MMNDPAVSEGSPADPRLQNSLSSQKSSWPQLALETREPTGFGHGWISGLISAVLGLAALGTVICFHFPGLTVAEIRGHYPVELIRGLLHLALVTAFLSATISICLRRNKVLGLVGIGSTLIAALLGGSNVQIGGDIKDTWLGLDWVVLDLMLYSAVYIPLERLFALHPEQPTFRRGWTTDLTYFLLNSFLVQIVGLLTIKPAMLFFDWARVDAVVAFLSSLPVFIQALLCVLTADLTQYWVHRAFHKIPFLWQFHAIHHSAEVMDWLAGSRLHFVDAIVTRSLTYIPLFLLGFSETAIAIYVVVVVIQATFIHANVRWQFKGIQRWVATPSFHHWHHAAEPQAVDKNFAVHSPLWDWLFGTYYLPGRWPERYGLCERQNVPSSWFRQLLYPFVRLWRHKS
jgi:sterol desaturase/sphingolipid hydroxylase (fatty acid hydroxylase superfamily)